MRTLGLLVAVLALAPQASPAQRPTVPEGTIIASVEVSGFDIDGLSPELREAIRSLVGTPLSQDRLNELASRIETERPRLVAAARAGMDPTGQAHVVFVASRQRDRDQDENVNVRYFVEHAAIEGVSDSDLTETMRDDLRELVDKRLDSEEAQAIEQRLRQALPRYDISRRILRGSQPGRIRLVYEARLNDRFRWLRFEPTRADLIYHSDQGWGSYLEFAMGRRNIRFTPIVAIGDGDALIEEYSGVGLRFETRKLGTDRLGVSLEWSTFDPTWRSATLDALAVDPRIAQPYDERSTITPLLKFAVTPEITLSAGVSIAELDALPPATGSEMANAAVASIAFGGRWKDLGNATHDVHSSLGVRAGRRALESDLVYTRYLGQGWYRYGWGHHRVLVAGMAGGITGDAPLFERFALGDSRTLRGWDKYDVAPAGGDRMIHASVEYGFRGMAVFLDAGSVWDQGGERRVRVSTGLGFRAGPAFLTVGFPLNTDNLTAVVALGLRAALGAEVTR